MNKATYEIKLAKTVVTDANTVGEAKAAQRLKRALERFWKTAAIDYIRVHEGIDLAEEERNWKENRFIFNLKPTGNVTIEVWLCDDYFPPVLGAKYVIQKKNLLK
jgi:hypothetical protein